MRWVVALVFVPVVVDGCKVGPSEERLGCLQGCGRDKDACILAAMTPHHIGYCDARSLQCNESCPR